ncbi:hypothetical protein [Flavobacterium sp. ASV13]|uniref:hypothetical protein n=1 Tax=Flavobacterium sp. ASV13 TaxID=1506583 RepID=UPI0005529312|nr:hypothetical protein [Flavobacterium sp. ASV13]
MKKTLLILSIFFLIISCKKSKQENLKNEIEDKITTNLNDPSSYEFNYIHLDSLVYMTNKEEIKIILNDIQDLNKKTDSKSQKTLSFLESKMDFLKLSNKNKYSGFFSFRAKNKFGAKILAEYAFEADSTYKLIYLKDNMGDTIYKDIQVIIEENNKLLKEANSK